MFNCSNVQMFICSNVPMFKSSNVQMFKCSNVKCQMSNVKYQMSNVNKVKLLSVRTSGVPPVIFELKPQYIWLGWNESANISENGTHKMKTDNHLNWYLSQSSFAEKHQQILF